MSHVDFNNRGKGQSFPDLDHPLPAPKPIVTHETRPFWQAAAEGRLLLVSCDQCGEVIWYPRRFCPVCFSLKTSWFEASGKGAIYSATVIRRAGGPYNKATPYALACVELDEGDRKSVV